LGWPVVLVLVSVHRGLVESASVADMDSQNLRGQNSRRDLPGIAGRSRITLT
jgi:hypothetical protein